MDPTDIEFKEVFGPKNGPKVILVLVGFPTDVCWVCDTSVGSGNPSGA